LDALTEQTRTLLGVHKETFKPLLAVLVQEETLSGEQLRDRMKQLAA